MGHVKGHVKGHGLLMSGVINGAGDRQYDGEVFSRGESRSRPKPT